MTSDSTATLRTAGGSEEISLSPIPEGSASFESDDRLLSFLYRLEAADTADIGIRPYYHYAIYLNPLPARRSAEILGGRLRNDLPLPPELQRYSWPVVRDNAQWLMAASETALAAGDDRWTRRVATAARQLLELDTRMALDRGSGLFKGVPRYLLSPSSLFPAWMDPVDLFQTMTLAENAAYHAALSNLERVATSAGSETGIAYPASALRDAVNSHLWNPSTGNYGAALYGSLVFPVRLPSADNAAQAVAILGGTASEAMAASIASKTPVGEFGAAPLSPHWNDDSVSAAEFPPLLLKTLWMAAMGTTANETAYSAAVSALVAERAKALFDNAGGRHRHPETGIIRPVATLVLRGFLGARFAPEGLYLAPAVPPELPGYKHLTGLRYRDALLNIRITGTGRALATFTIDGKPAAPFIPATLEGEHDVAITLAGTSAQPGSITLDDTRTTLPPAPTVSWPRPLVAVLRQGDDRADAGSHAVYLNGVLDEVTAEPRYAAASPRRLTEARFATTGADGTTGFTCAPRILPPKGWETLISAADIAVPGTRLVSDRKAAARVVESNRWKNRAIRFRFNAPAAGSYIIDARYSSGLGIVNPQRRTALRRLKINGVEAGIMVFPQYSPAWWNRSTGNGWQLPATFSSQLRVEMNQGDNEVEIVYFQPSPVYVDPLANTVLLDLIRLRRVE